MEYPVNVHEITCKKAFRKLPHRIGPYEYDMNIYRGCAHRCAYCFAVYSQRYLNNDSFYDDIYVKRNIAEQLEKQLASPRWNRQLINIGSVCDSYQPIEAQYQIMREVLPLLIRYRTPCIISTKSDLILRDLDLIAQLAEVTYVNIAVTITTCDEHLASLIEPNAKSVQRRLYAITEIKRQTQAVTGIHVMPIMPYLNDDEESLLSLIKLTKKANADYATFAPLHLHGETKRKYFQMLKLHFPHLVTDYEMLYRNGKLDPAYKKAFYERLQPLCDEYEVCIDYMKFAREFFAKQQVEQLSLW